MSRKIQFRFTLSQRALQFLTHLHQRFHCKLHWATLRSRLILDVLLLCHQSSSQRRRHLWYGRFTFCLETEKYTCSTHLFNPICKFTMLTVTTVHMRFICRTFHKDLVGPLSMHPPAEDNYGTDACSILFLSSFSLPVLIISTSSGQIHQCLVLSQQDEPTVSCFAYFGVKCFLSLI
jgi:hypothetical protein